MSPSRPVLEWLEYVPPLAEPIGSIAQFEGGGTKEMFSRVETNVALRPRVSPISFEASRPLVLPRVVRVIERGGLKVGA